MRVLIGCEFSGTVRRAFRDRGHDAWSCDVLPADDDSPFHIQDDVLNHLDKGWDIGIFHPPCTDLSGSGARWWAEKEAANPGFQNRAAAFFMVLYNAPIDRVAVENPVGAMSRLFRPPDQYVQPYQFGHPETKKTGLWLRNLPRLVPTNVVEGREARIHRMAPSPDRGKERSRTYPGLAEAFAEQWTLPRRVGVRVGEGG